MDFSVALSGIATGAAFGFVLQRGRFCFNTAFRDILYIKNVTLFRAYILALIVATLGANALEMLGVVSLGPARQELAWIANILGGYVFGVGMVLAGGSASGTWYRVGEGLIGSWMAALGFMVGAAAMKSGALSGVFANLRSFVLVPGTAVTMNGALGVNRWIIILIASAIGLVFVFRSRPTYNPARTEFHWRTTGILIGAVIVLSWYLSGVLTGSATGPSLTAPSEQLLSSIVGDGQWNWNVALVVGVPIGSFMSARGLHDFSWRAPRADVMVQQLSGGLMMGMGGMLAGGCPVGHGLTGLAALSVASLVTTVFIILGCWSMVYLLFMRGAVVK